jgi:tetratricopeptide (TPR) repeat protein
MSSNHVLSLDGIEYELKNNYPIPAALIFERYRDTRNKGLESQYRVLTTELLEVFLEFLSIVALSEAREHIRDFKGMLPEKAQDLKFLTNPGPGKWVFVLTEVFKIKTGSPDLTWIPKISDWFNQPENSETRAVLKALLCVPEISFNVNAKKPIAELVAALVSLRNRVAHDRIPPDEELSKRMPAVESAIAHLLKSATFLSEMMLFYTAKVEVTPDDRRLIHATVLRGTGEPETKSYRCDKPLAPSKLYLTVLHDEEALAHVISIVPFLLWRVGRGQLVSELFFYRYALHKKLLYLSYTTGHVDFSTDLSSFEDLVDLSIETGSIEDPYRDLTSEERSDRADDLYKRSIWLIQQDRLVLALECLEEAVELQSNPQIYLKMAQVLEGLNEPTENVIAGLEMCLRLEPNNDDALKMISRIRSGGYRESATPEDNQHTDDPKIAIFHLFCPRLFRKHAIPVWIAIISIWYLISTLAELSFGNSRFAIATVFALLGCLTVIAAAGVLRPWVAWLEKCLHQQMYDRKDEPFNVWYRKQQDLIFGYFCFDSGVLNVWRSIKREKYYYAGAVIWIVIMVTASILFSESISVPTPLLIKRLIDYVLLFAIVYAAARYTIAVTMFLNHLSRRELKPMLTKINEDGVRALGPFIAFSIALATVVYSLFHLSFAFANTTPAHIDFMFLCVGTAIAATWTVAFPFQLRKALKASKLSPVQRYSQHIKNAFEAFINEPNEANEKRYLRVLEMQKLLKRIPVWPLTATETILVIGGCNLLLALVATAYVISRLGSWDAVTNFMSHLWR